MTGHQGHTVFGINSEDGGIGLHALTFVSPKAPQSNLAQSYHGAALGALFEEQRVLIGFGLPRWFDGGQTPPRAPVI